jgi:hypothetical protein
VPLRVSVAESVTLDESGKSRGVWETKRTQR